MYKKIYTFIIDTELLILQHLKYNPFEMEKYMSVLDYQFYIETLFERIKKENDAKAAKDAEYMTQINRRREQNTKLS